MIRACLHKGCREPAGPGGRCAAHHRPRSKRRRTTWKQEVYAKRRWLRLRKHVLFQEPLCQHPDCEAIATECDHVVPLRAGGDPWARDNIQALCHEHHNAKTQMEFDLYPIER